MKITLQIYDKSYSVETNDDSANVHEMADHFKGLLVSAGFHPCNVDDLIDTDYKWFTDEEIEHNLQGHREKRQADVEQVIQQMRDNKDKDEIPF